MPRSERRSRRSDELPTVTDNDEERPRRNEERSRHQRKRTRPSGRREQEPRSSSPLEYVVVTLSDDDDDAVKSHDRRSRSEGGEYLSSGRSYRKREPSSSSRRQLESRSKASSGTEQQQEPGGRVYDEVVLSKALLDGSVPESFQATLPQNQTSDSSRGPPRQSSSLSLSQFESRQRRLYQDAIHSKELQQNTVPDAFQLRVAKESSAENDIFLQEYGNNNSNSVAMARASGHSSKSRRSEQRVSRASSANSSDDDDSPRRGWPPVGAFSVAGPGSRSLSFEEQHATTATDDYWTAAESSALEEEDDEECGGAAGNNSGRTTARSSTAESLSPPDSPVLIQARLVDDNDPELGRGTSAAFTQEERMRIEAETRERVVKEAVQAQVVTMDGDLLDNEDWRERRPRKCRNGSILAVIAIGVIALISVYFIMDRSSKQSNLNFQDEPLPSLAPSSFSLDNRQCDQAQPLSIGNVVQGFLSASDSESLQSGVTCGARVNVFTEPFVNQPGRWYEYVGRGRPVKISATNNLGGGINPNVTVYKSSDCSASPNDASSFECVEGGIRQDSSIMSWIAVSDIRYAILVHGSFQEDVDFTVSVTSNDKCTDAYGPVVLRSNFLLLHGATTSAAAAESPVNSTACGGAKFGGEAAAPGVWFTVQGTGEVMTASTCGGGTAFDSQVAVFTGDCGSFACVDGSNDACGLQSSLTWPTEFGKLYTLYLFGNNGETGSFALQLTSNAAPADSSDNTAGETHSSYYDNGTANITTTNDLCADAKPIQLHETIKVDLSKATADSDLEECSKGAMGTGPARTGVFYTIRGSGSFFKVMLEGPWVYGVNQAPMHLYVYSVLADATSSPCQGVTCQGRRDMVSGSSWLAAANETYYLFAHYEETYHWEGNMTGGSLPSEGWTIDDGRHSANSTASPPSMSSASSDTSTSYLTITTL